MRNKYPGECLVCGDWVQPKQGWFQRMNGRWKVRCLKCKGKGNEKVKDCNNAYHS